MLNIEKEIEERVAFIEKILVESKADGLVFGNSGGKDSALVGILCKKACKNTLGVIMPCETRRNYAEDKEDAIKVAEKFSIQTRIVDLKGIKQALVSAVEETSTLTPGAKANINPRLRMTVLYSIALSENRLVVGTGNKSEGYMGYFTKWGDGAYDLNPISDLTVTEIYELLRYLGAPEIIISKAPSAALFDGQTDEGEMGIKYSDLDRYIKGESVGEELTELISKAHQRSEHKRKGPFNYQPKGE
jgi:NAD+ synthase